MSKQINDTRPFRFKQFQLHHHRSSMKVGTDANLLGIWTNINDVKTVLDVGSGCGIIALLIASRSKAQVDAIELDTNSASEAKENFQESPFSQRMKLIHEDVVSFSTRHPQTYDLIVSNPPFFTNDLRSDDQRWSNARHGDTLNFRQLCETSVWMLKPRGTLSLVLPYDASPAFTRLAHEHGLYLSRSMLIFPRRGLPPNRINMEFVMGTAKAESQERLIIREEDHSYSQQFIDFMKDFYISF